MTGCNRSSNVHSTVHSPARPPGTAQRPEGCRHIERNEDMDRGKKWVSGVVLTAIAIGMVVSQGGDGQTAEARPDQAASAATVAPTATTGAATTTEAPATTVAITTTEAPTTTVAPTTTEAPTTTVAKTTTTTIPRAQVVRWVDGDTVETTVGTVRLIGMDTPERGAPCSAKATANADRLAPVGSTVHLIPVQGRDDTDHYDRLLRYVMRGRVDVGYRQIVHGLADARYDSGEYGTHPQTGPLPPSRHRASKPDMRSDHDTSSTTTRWHRRPRLFRLPRPRKHRQGTATPATRTSAFRLRRLTLTAVTSTEPTSRLSDPTHMGLMATTMGLAAKADLDLTTRYLSPIGDQRLQRTQERSSD